MKNIVEKKLILTIPMLIAIWKFSDVSFIQNRAIGLDVFDFVTCAIQFVFEILRENSSKNLFFFQKSFQNWIINRRFTTNEPASMNARQTQTQTHKHTHRPWISCSHRLVSVCTRTPHWRMEAQRNQKTTTNEILFWWRARQLVHAPHALSHVPRPLFSASQLFCRTIAHEREFNVQESQASNYPTKNEHTQMMITCCKARESFVSFLLPPFVPVALVECVDPLWQCFCCCAVSLLRQTDSMNIFTYSYTYVVAARMSNEYRNKKKSRAKKKSATCGSQWN